LKYKKGEYHIFKAYLSKNILNMYFVPLPVKVGQKFDENLGR